ncbi:MAG: SGNH/GDSL hydrolase family protein [Thermoanaerobaculaceae bacterium]|nr:SGNH/GDSL hydrolase family protein [Thermoanaerobaculaceae bacterium]MDI9623089.1 SGNH/GDSL hydrolase family protein [Acidobacteriota bacterium]NLH11380.1 SGNH/GDSL hydrolase family protein [Holophagae bacterium]HPW55404.1 SGNH/GDSL hydrolase family protein [Thermoanaerobaculaceae bacterium]
MRKASTLLMVGTLALGLAASSGAQVDFTHYVALGDSLTAGVASFGLVEGIQKGSYPALLARQAGVASTFQQPTVGFPGLPTTLELKALTITSQGVSPTIVPRSGIGQPTNATLARPYNNLGMDGADTNDILTIKGAITNLAADLQKYAAGQVSKVVYSADLVLRNGQNTAVELALAQQPTFLTVWAGNNDVLGAALVGVVMDGVTMTTAAEFEQQYQTLLGTLRAGAASAKIVVATIPDVTAIPYVFTVKPYLINPANGQRIPLIGEAGLVTENDFLLLGASSLLAKGIGIPVAAGGTGQPLPEGKIDQSGLQAGVILRAAEVQAIRKRTAELNAIIKTTAASVGAKVVDMHAIFNDIQANGRVVGGVRLSSAFLTGGLFSYDGVHPQALGYALVANEFIRVINSELGGRLSEVSLREFLPMASAATSVAASQVIFSAQAAVEMARSNFPNVDTSRLVVRSSPVRRHLGAAPEVVLETPNEP